MARPLGPALLALTLSAGCSSSNGFTCVEDSQCVAGTQPGVCVQGWCGFPDPACDSDHRFGLHVGDGLAGTCVPLEGDATTGTTAGTEGSTSRAETSVGDALDSGSDNADASTTGPVQLPDPIVWYSFDDPEDIWADVSGNGLHAWCGDPECGLPETGVVGGAVLLDGIASHGHIDHVRLLDTWEGFTLSAWAWPDSPQRNEQIIFTRPYESETDNSWQLGLTAADGHAFASIHADSWGSRTTAPWPEGEGWHHVAASWDGRVLQLYLDGAMVGSTVVAPIVFDTQVLQIGADVQLDADTQYFGGLLDEVQLYDVALSGPQIAALASR